MADTQHERAALAQLGDESTRHALSATRLAHRGIRNQQAFSETDSEETALVSELTPVSRPSSVPWPPLLLVMAVVAAVALNRMRPLPWPGVHDTPARIVGLGIGVAGLALIVWAAMTLWRHNTTVLPNRGVSELVTDGPFRWRRNPIYVGDAMVLLGAAEMTNNIWFAIIVVPFVLLVTWLAILPEERHLEAKFGDRWRAYRDSTRRWI